MQNYLVELANLGAEVHVFNSKDYFEPTKFEWCVNISYTTKDADEIKVKRRGTDLEAAIIAAYDAFRSICQDGVRVANLLPAPNATLAGDHIPY